MSTTQLNVTALTAGLDRPSCWPDLRRADRAHTFPSISHHSLTTPVFGLYPASHCTHSCTAHAWRHSKCSTAPANQQLHASRCRRRATTGSCGDRSHPAAAGVQHFCSAGNAARWMSPHSALVLDDNCDLVCAPCGKAPWGVELQEGNM